MQAVEIDITRGEIYDMTLDALNRGAKVIIHKGGTGSGKTYDIMVFLLFHFAANNPNFIITIVSESKPHLDIGAIRYAKQLIYGTGLNAEITMNETRSFFTFPNGAIVEFFSADRIDKALGARRDVLYGNEINSLKEEVWDELARRSDIILGDFNPTSQFWLERWLTYYDDTEVILSNHTHNLYLKDTERQRIIKRAAVDPNFKRIHIDCEYGVYEGLIFNNFVQVDEIPDTLQLTYGLDFGYTNDPTALIAVAKTGEAWYLDEVVYETELRNAEISNRMKHAGVDRNALIFADSAEPKSIDDLRLMGWNVQPTVKGKDSIMWGIDLMQQRELRVTKRSVNLIKELRNYSYMKDKTGEKINRPIDAYNHAIDACRYSIMSQQAAAGQQRTALPINRDRRF